MPKCECLLNILYIANIVHLLITGHACISKSSWAPTKKTCLLLCKCSSLVWIDSYESIVSFQTIVDAKPSQLVQKGLKTEASNRGSPRIMHRSELKPPIFQHSTVTQLIGVGGSQEMYWNCKNTLCCAWECFQEMYWNCKNTHCCAWECFQILPTPWSTPQKNYTQRNKLKNQVWSRSARQAYLNTNRNR